MLEKNVKKKGLSPVIATMLLVAIVIVIGLIVFLWFKGINEEAITKFDGTNIKLICDEVSFDADYSNAILYILNTGNVPIYKMKVKAINAGSHSTTLIETDWPELGLNQGGTYSGSLSDAENITKLILIPVLMGSSNTGDSSYTCEERNGYEILI